MKLLLLSMNFSPELTGIGKYSGEMAQGLVDRGHEVTVVCAPAYYPAWRVGPGPSGYSVERPRPGLAIYRCPLWVPGRPSAVRRLLHQASFVLSSLPVLLGLALRQRPEVVIAVAPATFCAPAAWLAARLCGARAWLHVQDLELDAAFGLGFLRGRGLQRACLAAERTLLRGFDHVSTISRRMLRQLACKGVDLSRSSLVPNWVDLDAVRPSREDAGAKALRAELDIGESQKVALFAGTMNRKQGLGVLLDAATQLQSRSDIVFVFCGQGEMRAGLQAAATGLPNVRFLDLQPVESLGSLLAMADVHLLPQLRGAADLVLPSKLGGMLASGRPIIAAAEAGTEIAATVLHCGASVTPESAAAFCDALVALCDDGQRRRDLGAAARYLAEGTLGAAGVLDRLSDDLQVLARGAVPQAKFPARAEAQR
jgi:colanic acid biosynthesis glycosyl transferase WcaI